MSRGAALILLVVGALPAAAEAPRPRPAELPVARSAGPICGASGIVGVPVPPVSERGGCRLQDAAAVESVDGVALSPPAILTCETARTLSRWVGEAAKPAFADLGGLVGLDVAAAYVCRTRNNRPGAKLSEHALGRAVDIGGFRLADGRSVTVGAPETPPEAAAVSRALAGGCGPFTTALGPGADAFHETHLHFDIARRQRTYCR